MYAWTRTAAALEVFKWIVMKYPAGNPSSLRLYGLWKRLCVESAEDRVHRSPDLHGLEPRLHTPHTITLQ